MIMIDRKEDEVIYIRPKNNVDMLVNLQQLFDYGDISISIEEIGNNQVKIGLCLPDELEAFTKKK